MSNALPCLSLSLLASISTIASQDEPVAEHNWSRLRFCSRRSAMFLKRCAFMWETGAQPLEKHIVVFVFLISI